MTDVKELERRMAYHQALADAAKQAGDRETFWQARRDLLTTQAEYWNATRGTNAATTRD